MVEALNLFKKKEPKEDVIEFDDLLEGCRLTWRSTGQNSSHWDAFKELIDVIGESYGKDYRLFVCQDKCGATAIFRKKIKNKGEKE